MKQLNVWQQSLFVYCVKSVCWNLRELRQSVTPVMMNEFESGHLNFYQTSKHLIKGNMK